jgi:hypothetical protein
LTTSTPTLPDGWTVFHAEQPREEIVTYPGHFRAHKAFDGRLVEFDAETLEQLVAQCEAYEREAASRD